MQAFRIAVFFALLGALTGFFEGVMAYTPNPWWPGVENLQYNNSTTGLTSDDIDALSVSDQSYSTTETVAQEFDIMSVAIKSLKGVFGITSFVEDAMFGKSDSELRTIFHGFLLVVQVGIYLIYAMGLLQLWRRTPMAGGY